MEFKEIQKRIKDEPHGHVPSDRNSEEEPWFLGFNKKGGDVFVKNVRVVVEDISNQHENVEFGFRNKEELLEDEKKMLKNMPEVKLHIARLPCPRNVEKKKQK